MGTRGGSVWGLPGGHGGSPGAHGLDNTRSRVRNAVLKIAKKNHLVGLDIGSHAVKLVEFEHARGGGLTLKHFGIALLPYQTIVEGTIRDPDRVSTCIRNLVNNLGVKNRNVATSVSGYSVIVKKISMPSRDDVELETAIHEEAEQYIPFDMSEVNLDFDLLTDKRSALKTDQGNGEKAEAKKVEVLLVAAKKEVVESYVSVIEEAGLNPVVVDVDLFALQNAAEIGLEDRDLCIALLHIGASELGINVIRGGTSLFSRDTNQGGGQLTEKIMAGLDVGYPEAERIKLGGTEAGKETQKLKEIFAGVVTGWAKEIRRALDFVMSTYPDTTIGKIWISGGASRIPGFMKYLSKEVLIPVEAFNPFSEIAVNEKIFDPVYIRHMAPQASVAVGLALRSIGDK